MTCRIPPIRFARLGPNVSARMNLGVDEGDTLVFDGGARYSLVQKDEGAKLWIFEGLDRDIIIQKFTVQHVLVNLTAVQEIDSSCEEPLVRVGASMAASGASIGSWLLPGSGEVRVTDVMQFVAGEMDDSTWGPDKALRFLKDSVILERSDVLWSP